MVGLVALLLFSTADAKDYKIEAVIFENLRPYAAYENYRYQPIAQISSAAPTWPLEKSMLVTAANEIDADVDYRLLHHYSWGQETLPSSQAAIYTISEENAQGWFKIYASQLLFANIDIDFNGYRMVEKRRLKLDEKHFFDHPKFGVLLQVSRLQPTPEDSSQASDNPLSVGLDSSD